MNDFKHNHLIISSKMKFYSIFYISKWKLICLTFFLKLNFSEFPWINSTIQRCYSASVIPKSVEKMFCWAFSVDFVGIARISRYYRLKEGNLCDCWRHAKLCRMHLFDTHLEEVVKKGEMDRMHSDWRIRQINITLA